MKVDAHQHFWNLDEDAYPWLSPSDGPIYRNFAPEDLVPHLKRCGIDKTILVQAMNSGTDTDTMFAIARRHPWVGGVIGWVPLDEPETTQDRLEDYCKHGILKGIRHLIHEEPDPHWVLRNEVIDGLRILAHYNLPFDYVAVFPDHLGDIPYLLEKVPALTLVIDHLGKPPIKDGSMSSWRALMQVAASYPQVYAKVSGLNTAANRHWTTDDIRPYVDEAARMFGINRLVFGSDWPVLNLSGTYEQVWETMINILADYGPEACTAILGGNAAKLYGVKE